jgi:hypothetical protein
VRVGAEAGVVEIFRAGVEGWALGLLAEALRGVRGALLLFVEGLRFVGVTSSSSLESWSGDFAIFWKYANSSVSPLNGKKVENECATGHTYIQPVPYQATIARRGGKTRISSKGIVYVLYVCG